MEWTDLSDTQGTAGGGRMPDERFIVDRLGELSTEWHFTPTVFGRSFLTKEGGNSALTQRYQRKGKPVQAVVAAAAVTRVPSQGDPALSQPVHFALQPVQF
jgi:hypothetical protein